jgi:DNA invertase Pin-like site-specific DNA recombinase
VIEMATGKFVAYYRVSTQGQGASGLGLEAQQEAVRNYLNGGRWKLVTEVTEIESGKRNDRPALAKAMSLCRLHGATLVIAKLNRLARNVHFISALMEDKDVPFVAADFPQANRLTIHILAIVAEHEAEMISKRTKDALAAAKARGAKLGGDRSGTLSLHAMKGTQASAKARSATSRRRAADILPAIEAIRSEGATTLQGIAETLNARSIPAPRGGLWSAVQVSRVLAQA